MAKLLKITNTKKNTYRDKSERFLFDFFKKPQSQKNREIREIMCKKPSWPIKYHLSPRREFLLDWYPFKKTESIFEIGAGCGALTGLFCRKLNKVYANELTYERASIIKKRFSNCTNLEVIAGNIFDYKRHIKTDYISVIGVLEYAGLYSLSKKQTDPFVDPFIVFLKYIKRFLKHKGHLLLAIENKLGIKYIAGGREDHYGDFFSSLENYPNYDGKRTFTQSELKTILKSAGFKSSQFYYPYPDYKLPKSILTKKGFALNLSKSSFAKIVDHPYQRFNLFNEIPFAHSLSLEGVLSSFANSFLVDAVI